MWALIGFKWKPWPNAYCLAPTPREIVLPRTQRQAAWIPHVARLYAIRFLRAVKQLGMKIAPSGPRNHAERLTQAMILARLP